MQAPKKYHRGRRVAANIGSAVLLGVALLFVWALAGGLIREWRSGAAFVRYRNWQGMPVSHADALIVLAVAFLALFVGGVWAAIDRWKDRRLKRKLGKDRHGLRY
jgi:hypothetical protein